MKDLRLVRDLAVPLRDGTVTRAEAWIPEDGRPGPAILIRTPYGKESAAPSPIADARLAAERGYALVAQDVRGRGSSDGEFEPFVSEERDGADSVEWLAQQPWCDGRVVMAGMSYVGATQWLAAAAAPEPLAAIAPTLSSDEFGEGWSYYAGVPEVGFLATWSAVDLAERWQDDPLRGCDDPGALARIAPWSEEWLREPPGSDYWRARSVAHRRDEIGVPVLVVAGWYDLFCDASLRSFARSRNEHDRLIVGPWAHDSGLSQLVGDASTGFAGSGDAWPLFERLVDFYDAALDGRPPDSPRVRAYVLGERRWVGLDAWPPPGAEPLELELAPASLEVDPRDPVPSRGGRTLLIEVPPHHGWGIRDQRPIAGRADVATAVRNSTPKRRLLAGPVSAELRTEAAAGSQWVVTLCVEQADGALHNLSEGIALDDGSGSVTVALGDVCVSVEPGQALVALVAGSSFPRWPRPPARGRQELLDGSRLRLTSAAL